MFSCSRVVVEEPVVLLTAIDDVRKATAWLDAVLAMNASYRFCPMADSLPDVCEIVDVLRNLHI